MNFSPFTINARQFTTDLAVNNEFQFKSDTNYLFDLAYLSTLSISGERAAEFLQGQLSCDIRNVSETKMQQGAMCNLKGRVLALLDVVDWRGLHLVLPKDLIPVTQFSLSKTAMLSRVKLEITDQYHIFGFYMANRDDLLPFNLSLPNEQFAVVSTEQACCYRLSQQLYLIIIRKDQTTELCQQFSSKEQLRGSLAWHYLQLKTKSVEIYPDTRGLFLPHRIDLQRSGYLSFDKGCYKGQEIIARTHYRAKLKHSLELFTIVTSETIKAGKKLFSASGETEVGELIDFCPLANNCYLIAASILFDAPNEILIEAHKAPVLIERLC